MPYPPARRKYTTKKYGMRRYKGKKDYAASKIQAVVRRALNKNIETKTGIRTNSTGLEILHNNFIVLTSTPLETTLGVADNDTNTGNRIGDEINLRGLSIKFMVELNERFSDVTYRFMIVKSAKGDTPTRATLFNGIVGNKMIDTFNRERYTIIKSKTFKLTAPNPGTQGGGILGPPASGINSAIGNEGTLSRSTKIMKFWIDGKRFSKSGIIKYENGTTQPKFFDYHVLLFAYSNYTTSQDFFNVGRLNDYVLQLYYKDA